MCLSLRQAISLFLLFSLQLLDWQLLLLFNFDDLFIWSPDRKLLQFCSKRHHLLEGTFVFASCLMERDIL